MDEFAELLSAAARHLIDQCQHLYCDPPPPSAFAFVLTPTRETIDRPPRGLVSAAAAAAFLVRPDGAFRDWVNLSPIGISQNSTVIELVYADRFATRLLTGDIAFPFEPLHLLGPSMPPDWSEGDPVPRVALPELDIEA